jgi:hypothetical protein
MIKLVAQSGEFKCPRERLARLQAHKAKASESAMMVFITLLILSITQTINVLATGGQ